MAAAKKSRAVELGGVRHTDESLRQMKTGEIAALVAAMRGGNPPKPATKARAIEIFWALAETLPQEPAAAPEAKRKPNARAESSEATAETRSAKNQASAKPRKAKTYSIAEGASLEGLLPQARELAGAMQAAGKALTMAEVAGLLRVRKTSKRPDRVCAWYFAKVFRPLGLLIEERGK